MIFVALDLGEAEACALADELGELGDRWIVAWVRCSRRASAELRTCASNAALVSFMPHQDCLMVTGSDGYCVKDDTR